MLGIDVKESAGLATSAISCFDFAYVTAVLHHGLGFPMTDEAFLYKDGSGDIAGYPVAYLAISLKLNIVDVESVMRYG